MRKNGAGPIEILAVNAHLLYRNKKSECTRELLALSEWLVLRAKSRHRMFFKNMILMCSTEDVAKAATKIGSPVSLKLLNVELSHKNRIGGLQLNVQSAAEVGDGY